MTLFMSWFMSLFMFLLFFGWAACLLVTWFLIYQYTIRLLCSSCYGSKYDSMRKTARGKTGHVALVAPAQHFRKENGNYRP